MIITPVLKAYLLKSCCVQNHLEDSIEKYDLTIDNLSVVNCSNVGCATATYGVVIDILGSFVVKYSHNDFKQFALDMLGQR